MELTKIGSSDIQDVHKFTGVGIARVRDRRLLTLTQAAYINELAERYQGKIIKSYLPTGALQESLEEHYRLKPGEEGMRIRLTWQNACN